MKILFLSAANSIHTVRWVNGMSERGHEVHLVYNAGHEPKEDAISEKVKLHRLKYSGGKGYYLNAKQLSDLSREIDADVINVHYASGYGTLARQARLNNILLSVWGSDVYEFPYKSFINNIILKKNVKYAYRIASTSECMSEQLRKVVHMPDLKIDITPFGVDMDRFTPQKRTDKDEFIVGTVKALKPVYKIDDFIKGIAQMKSSVKVYIYGDGEQKEELQNLIDSLNLESRVFLKGKIPNVDVPDVLQTFDVFCAMSEKESFGVAVVEAMAMNLPVVVSDAEGFREVVVDNETGYIVPVGDTVALAEKLEELKSNREKRLEFGKAGRERAEQLYDWQKNLDTMEMIYQEMNQKKCIVHIPNTINTQASSGSQIRPLAMYRAFQNCGYDVDLIMGESNERKVQIDRIKKNIKNGEKYEFLYAESSTMPTLLTDRNHFPRHPFLDFGFFKFCKKHNIKIGLFYRDIQWKFPFYKEAVSAVKRMISIPMYKYDLSKYAKLLDIIYLPTKRMEKYLSEYPALMNKSDVLMPGAKSDSVICEEQVEAFEQDGVHLFYVGGIVGIYDIKIFLEAISKVKGINTIVCCREQEWESARKACERYLTDNIRIVHASGKELDKYYKWADICSVLGGSGEYFSMAMPVKVFEYLSKRKPMLGITGTASGDFIQEENIGWCMEYSVEDISKCVKEIISNLEDIRDKENRIHEICINHTWEERARKVIRDLEVAK